MNNVVPLNIETPASEIDGIWPVLNAKSKIFDAECTVRAYTPNVLVNSKGWVKFNVVGMRKEREVGRPFHFLFDKVLYGMKINKMKMSDSFGMSHELFADDMHWECSVILHFIDSEPRLFIISRDEWMKFGTLPSHQSEELQVFVEMPDERSLPLSMIPRGGLSWLKECCKLFGLRGEQ